MNSLELKQFVVNLKNTLDNVYVKKGDTTAGKTPLSINKASVSGDLITLTDYDTTGSTGYGDDDKIYLFASSFSYEGEANLKVGDKPALPVLYIDEEGIHQKGSKVEEHALYIALYQKEGAPAPGGMDDPLGDDPHFHLIKVSGGSKDEPVTIDDLEPDPLLINGRFTFKYGQPFSIKFKIFGTDGSITEATRYATEVNGSYVYSLFYSRSSTNTEKVQILEINPSTIKKADIEQTNDGGLFRDELFDPSRRAITLVRDTSSDYDIILKDG